MYIKINNVKVKLQLDTGSDISIINEETWKKIGTPLLKKTDKVACRVSGKRLDFKDAFTYNISFVGKMLKSKIFGTDWIVLFIYENYPYVFFVIKLMFFPQAQIGWQKI